MTARRNVPRGPALSTAPTSSSAVCESWRELRKFCDSGAARILLVVDSQRAREHASKGATASTLSPLFVVKEYKEHLQPPQIATANLTYHQKKVHNEYKLLRKLTHCNIIKLYNNAEPKHSPASDGSSAKPTSRQSPPQWNGKSCIPLELMDLGCVKDVVSKLHCDSEITEEHLVELAKAIAVPALLGLQYLHSNKMIHRDVKPENLLLNREGRVKWCDFETAFNRHQEESESGTEKVADTLCGTNGFYAPELIILQGESYTNKVDIWSCGALLYWIIRKQLPDLVCQVSRLALRMNEDPTFQFRDLFDLRRNDGGIEELIYAMLAQNPAERPTATEAVKHPSLAQYYSGATEAALLRRFGQGERRASPTSPPISDEEAASAASASTATSADGSLSFPKNPLEEVVEWLKSVGKMNSLYTDAEERELEEYWRALEDKEIGDEDRKRIRLLFNNVIFTRQRSSCTALRDFFAKWCSTAPNSPYGIVKQLDYETLAALKQRPV